MRRRRRRPEQAVQGLAVADRMRTAGVHVREVCRALQISEATYYRWRIQFAGLTADQAMRLKNLQQEIATLRRLLADAELERDGYIGIVSAHRSPALPDDGVLGEQIRAEDLPAMGAALAGLSTAGMDRLRAAIAKELDDDDQAEDYGLVERTGADASVEDRD